MENRSLLVVCLALFLTGCASSKLDYTPPVIKKVENQVTINEPFEIVWDRLVKNLASDFFDINNIEKSSRLINVSFTSSEPTHYATCGNTRRQLNTAGGTQHYQYDPAASSKFTSTSGISIFNTSIETQLAGRANIYVAPTEDNKTLISVNVKYVVGSVQTYTTILGEYGGQRTFKVDFSTMQHYTEPSGLVCTANGKLEAMILDYSKSNAKATAALP